MYPHFYELTRINMSEQELELLRYPIGRFQKPESLSAIEIEKCINTIGNFPVHVIAETAHLGNEQLDAHYRPGGWTIRQVVHHCADSHMNALVRFKLTLTEDSPTIKPYFEDRWAELADTKTMPILASLEIIKGVHHRWVILLKSMKSEDYSRTYIHPEYGTTYRLDQALANYDWHCKHHLAHITTTKRREIIMEPETGK